MRGLQLSRLVCLLLIACIDTLGGHIHHLCHRAKSLQRLRKVPSRARIVNLHVHDHTGKHAIGDGLGVAETKLAETTDDQGHRDRLEARTPPTDPNEIAHGISA